MNRERSRKLTAVGMMLLAVAGLVQWYLHRHAVMAHDAADLTSGALYGIAIGTLVVGLRNLRRGP